MPSRRTAAMLPVALVLAAGGLLGCTADDDGSTDAFCDQVVRAPALATVIAGASNRSPETVRAQLDDASEAFDALAEAAPRDIRGEVDEVVALVDVIVDAVAEHPDDNEAAAAAIRDAVDDHPKAAEASVQIGIYTLRECSVELDQVGSESTGTSTTTEP